MIEASRENRLSSIERIGAYQFSVFELAVNELRLTHDDGSTQNLLDNVTTINTTDQSLQIFYDLIANSNDPLATFGPARELVFAVGGDEQLATTQAGQDLTYTNLAHLAELSSSDLLSIRLYQNSDMENILWEFSLAALEVRSSGDLGSRAKNSFLIRPTEQPIQVEWVSELRPTDTLAWKVEALIGSGCDEHRPVGNRCPSDDLALEENGGSGESNKPYAYGQVQHQWVGQVIANNPATGEVDTGTGRFETPWQSIGYSNNEANQFSFLPDMTDEPHLPAVFNSNTDPTGLDGTESKDVWRRNPMVGYKITALLNGNPSQSVTVKMDEIDAIRQEYIYLNTTATTQEGQNYPIPERDKFKPLSALPPVEYGFWVEQAGRFPYAYSYVLEDGMVRLWTDITSGFSSYRTITFVGFNGAEFTIPSNATKLNSGYRNPERQERCCSSERSKHMSGGAIDIGFNGVTPVTNPGPDDTRGKLFGPLWEMVRDNQAVVAPTATFFQLEDRDQNAILTSSGISNPDPAQDVDGDNIPDQYENTYHLHVQH